MREEIEWIIQEANKTLESVAESDDTTKVLYAGQSAIVQLLGSLLEKIAGLREDLEKRTPE